MHFLHFVLTALAFANVFGQETGWYQGNAGGTCDAKCTSVGLKCNAEEQSTLTTCELVTDAFAKAGFECNGCPGSRDYNGSPFLQNGKNCYFFTPGDKKSVCNANGANNHAPLCYCEKEEAETTKAPEGAEGCSVFDIDGFLTDCSEEFPAAQKEIDEVHTAMKEEIARLETAQTALSTKVDTEVARLDTELSDGSTATETLDTKVDEQVQRLDALIDEVEQTLATMSNLNAAQSEFGNVDGDMMAASAAQTTQDLMIYALVIFNIGTLMGCVSCIYWSQKKTKRVVYDEVNQ